MEEVFDSVAGWRREPSEAWLALVPGTFLCVPRVKNVHLFLFPWSVRVLCTNYLYLSSYLQLGARI